MKRYIQRKDHYSGQLETVDETDEHNSAAFLLHHYRTADTAATYYASRRPCKEWRDDGQK